jgi:RNA polymerase sigma factor (sigma-70 family)
VSELSRAVRRSTSVDRSLSDAEALRRSGDCPERFVVLYERHHAAVHNFLRRRLGVDLADDLAAETFVRAFRARMRFRPQGDSARPWLMGIASNLVREHHRSEQRALSAWRREAARASRAVDAERAAVDPELVESLRRLSRRDREALLLHVWGELSYAEVAEALDIPIGTVRSRVHHARRRLIRHHGAAVHTNPGEANA